MIYSTQHNQSPCQFRAIGVMSGTSLDGLDICLAQFNYQKKWEYSIIDAQTVNYTSSFRDSLKKAMSVSAEELIKLDAFLGKWIGEQVSIFLKSRGTTADIIGSHGHTIFHNPALGYSTQIGHGAHIAAKTGIPCVCDFRMGDVARGGQGAPLVPIGDELLFPDYDFCLNIGGIANISYHESGNRVAYDICPANMAINQIVNSLGLDMDEGGNLGKSGSVNPKVLEELNSLEYYSAKGAKSLGREWFDATFSPILDKYGLENEDALRTIYEHISERIAMAVSHKPNSSMLITGGGAKNTFLIDLLTSKCKSKLIVPSNQLIDYKEALIFAFLSVLYLKKTPSSLSSVTGASNDSLSGCLYY
jgi:anhydro-N-acetylmuramic acid kinase